jgi:hypothetical protein
MVQVLVDGNGIEVFEARGEQEGIVQVLLVEMRVL